MSSLTTNKTTRPIMGSCEPQMNLTPLKSTPLSYSQVNSKWPNQVPVLDWKPLWAQIANVLTFLLRLIASLATPPAHKCHQACLTVTIRLRLHCTIYRLRFYPNLLIRI